jgi:sugar (pentulose or hexulose) kinase
VPERSLTDGERAVAVSWYLALMTSVCLGEIGAEGPTVVEGPFAANDAYCAMLRAATGRPVARARGTGTSAGAALLVVPGPPALPPDDPAPAPEPALAAYADAWRALSAEPEAELSSRT